VLRPLTDTTEFQFHLHTVCVAPFDPKNAVLFLTYTLLRPLTQKHNFFFNLHPVYVVPFDQHNTIPVSSYTLFVLRSLTQETQFHF